MQDFSVQLEKIGEYGVIEELSPPIVIIAGLPGAHLHEIVLFETGQMGEVFVLERDRVQVLVFSTDNLKVGTRVTRTNKFLAVPVGEEMLGAAVDPLGFPFSNKYNYKRPKEERQVDTPPLDMPYRSKIRSPFLTGVSVIDTMIPLGKGQKELVIGDRKTGKTSFLFSTIKTQIALGTVVVYAAIAKKKSDIKKALEFFEKEGLQKNIVVVATSSFDSASLIYLTPFSAMTIGEFFRDQGKDVLVVLDDLSTHAKFYREVSLLAKRFPGRESYPGDIFYTHARLLERAGNYMLNGKEVSVTVLPVAELVEGDFTGYIATNLMGMTDGHLYFDSNVYYNGRRPALNIALSVTRVGRQATTSLQRSINRELTAFLALYDKMQNLSHFGAELTDTVKQILTTGAMVYDFFEQGISEVVPLNVQLVLFSMLWLKLLDNPNKQSIAKWRTSMIHSYQDPTRKEIVDNLVKTDSFNQLLNNVMNAKDKLLPMCAAQTQATVSTQQAPQMQTAASGIAPQPVVNGSGNTATPSASPAEKTQNNQTMQAPKPPEPPLPPKPVTQ